MRWIVALDLCVDGFFRLTDLGAVGGDPQKSLFECEFDDVVLIRTCNEGGTLHGRGKGGGIEGHARADVLLGRYDAAVVGECTFDQTCGHIDVLGGHTDLVVGTAHMDVGRHVARDGAYDLLQELCGDNDADLSRILLQDLALDGEAVDVGRCKRDLSTSIWQPVKMGRRSRCSSRRQANADFLTRRASVRSLMVNCSVPSIR